MSIIWATRGRTWGFRFLKTGGLADPLPTYESAFATVGSASEVVVRLDDSVALRFIDPDHRADRSGRPISHDFVLSGELAERVRTVDDGVATVWPLVAEEYAELWDSATPPRATD